MTFKFGLKLDREEKRVELHGEKDRSRNAEIKKVYPVSMG